MTSPDAIVTLSALPDLSVVLVVSLSVHPHAMRALNDFFPCPCPAPLAGCWLPSNLTTQFQLSEEACSKSPQLPSPISFSAVHPLPLLLGAQAPSWAQGIGPVHVVSSLSGMNIQKAEFFPMWFDLALRLVTGSALPVLTAERVLDSQSPLHVLAAARAGGRFSCQFRGR